MTTYIKYSRNPENARWNSDPDDSVLQTNWSVNDKDFIAIKPEAKEALTAVITKYKYATLTAEDALTVLNEWFPKESFVLSKDGLSIEDKRVIPNPGDE